MSRRTGLPRHLLAATSLLFAVAVLGCGSFAGFGVSGQYLDGKREVTRGRGGNIDLGIVKLENVVKQDPLYQDSLTLLGRAYYKRGRYKDSSQILLRAVAVNKDDETAWIMLGLTQMQLGDDQRGLESLKGGLSLLVRASKNGFKGIEFWDRNKIVATALRRTIFLATKGLEEKVNLIRQTEELLQRIDDEERRGKGEQSWEEPGGY